jgi:hypothetical protein
MAFSARLDMDPLSNVRVLDFSYSFSRDIDPTGKPSGGVRGGTIHITIESTGKAPLYDWIIDPTKTKDGTIKIEDPEEKGSSLKEIKFEKAYIIEYSESFNWQGGENMTETFSISAEKINIGGNDWNNEWGE